MNRAAKEKERDRGRERWAEMKRERGGARCELRVSRAYPLPMPGREGERRNVDIDGCAPRVAPMHRGSLIPLPGCEVSGTVTCSSFITCSSLITCFSLIGTGLITCVADAGGVHHSAADVHYV